MLGLLPAAPLAKPLTLRRPDAEPSIWMPLHSIQRAGIATEQAEKHSSHESASSRAIARVHALAGTETAAAFALVSCQMRELFATRPACPHDSAVTESFGVNDEGLIIAYPVSADALAVAAVARWDKVGGVIPLALPVDVVNDQRARFRARAGHPINPDAAPVAGVRTGADAVIEQSAVGTNAPGLVSKRVPVGSVHPVRTRVLLARLASALRAALMRTVPTAPSSQLGNPKGELRTATLAGAFDLLRGRTALTAPRHAPVSFRWRYFTMKEAR